MKKDITVSIIIVQYKVKKILLECITSIIAQTEHITYEIIVVDNDEIKSLKTELHKKFPQVHYIPNINRGFGQGNNIGAAEAHGEYLFFLNPDTLVWSGAIRALVEFFQKNKNIGIAAPLLLHPNGKLFDLQGLGKLTPISGIVALSFINKLFPKNPVSKKYWLPLWDKTQVKEVDTIPGTAFIIRRTLYQELSGFDEHFFLYFEEFDLCKRVKDKGYRICMLPTSKVTHLWGESTKHRTDIGQIFQQSRFYYFKKHFGVLNALLVELFARSSKEVGIVLSILTAGLLLAVINIGTLMTFIGDQAWFYLSARDMLEGKGIPLVGITSSHTWLHQGPLWTYLLALGLWLGNFNPLSGAVVSIGIGLVTLLALYVMSKRMFGVKVAVVAMLLYSTSPLVILHSRMPYHTTPIPFFALLYFFSLFQWISGNKRYFSVALVSLAVLYNFELATVILAVPLILISLFGWIKKCNWTVSLTKKDIRLSLGLACIPMLPVFLYDTTHGFHQTIVYAGWLVAQGLHILGISLYPFHPVQQSIHIFQFTLMLLQRLLFLPSAAFTLTLLSVSVIYAVVMILRQYQRARVSKGLLISLLWFGLTTLFYFANSTPSEAYLPMLFPIVILLVAYFLSTVTEKTWLTVGAVSVINLFNMIFLLQSSYLTTNPGVISLQIREQAVDRIISQTRNEETYMIKGKGSGSQFESFTMPYEYLAWYKGYPVNKTNPTKVFILEEVVDKVEIHNSL